MAFAVIPNEAELYLLRFGLAGADVWHVRLYKNDLTPDPDTVVGDFDEADYDGYDDQDWTITPVTTDGVGRAVLQGTLKEFNGPPDEVAQDIYGWYVTNGLSNAVMMCSRFASAPKSMASPDDVIKIDLAFRAYDRHQ